MCQKRPDLVYDEEYSRVRRRVSTQVHSRNASERPCEEHRGT